MSKSFRSTSGNFRTSLPSWNSKSNPHLRQCGNPETIKIYEAEGVEGSHLPVNDAGPRGDSRKRASQLFELSRAIVYQVEMFMACILRGCCVAKGASS